MAEEWGLDKGDKALNQISTHEQVCEQRYLRIEERLMVDHWFNCSEHLGATIFRRLI
jgi:hypothetical protein